MEFLKQYCLDCHGPDKPEADLRLDELGELPEAALTRQWHAIWNRLSKREMPPEEAPQPTASQRQQMLKQISDRFGQPSSAAADHWAFQPLSRPELPDGTNRSLHPIDAFIRDTLDQHQLTPAPPADRHTLIRRVTLDLTGLPPSPEEVRTFVDDPASLEDAFAEVVERLLQSPRYGERWAQHWLDVIRWAETVGFETNLERPEAWHYRDWVIRAFNSDLPYDRFLLEQIAGDATGHDSALGFLVAGPANLPGQIGRDEEAMRQARQDELDEVIRTVSQSLFGLTIGCARCHDHKFDPITQRDYYALQATFAGLTYGNRRLRGERNDQWTAQVPTVRRQLQQLLDELEQTRVHLGLQPSITSVQTESFAPIEVDAIRMEIAATESGAASLYEFEIFEAGQPATAAFNVALADRGSVPTASSFALANQTRHFDNLVDGSVDRRQAFPWVAASGGPAWIEVGLKQPAVIDRIRWHAGSSTPASYEIKVRPVSQREWITVADTSRRMPRTSDLRPANSIQLAEVSDQQIQQLVDLLGRIRSTQSELTRLSNGPQVYAARFDSNPAPTWLLKRGDPMQRADVVAPAVPEFLASDRPPAAITTEPDRRLRLVQHLTDPQHPLTARVIANRIWQHHFGLGIVDTPSDFGRMGSAPTHPRLLDWLATELTSHNWSIKHLHRTILSSETYRQSSHPRIDALAVDAETRYLWRFPPRRLEAEAIRDSILFASGKLNFEMYGRGFDLFDRRGGLSDYTAKETFDASGWRRMIYAHKIRMQAVDIFGAFDCPDAGQMTPRRNVSITPLQSLGLFNSPFVNRQAGFFAERVQREHPDRPQRQIEHVFQLALGRPPSDSENQRMLQLARSHGMEQVCRVVLNSSEFVFLH